MTSLTRRGLLAATTLIFTLGMAGCYPQAHMQDLKDTVLKSYTTSTPDRLYYTGSDNSYDYFYLQNEGKRYKVTQSESTQFSKMSVTEDRSLWQVVSPGAALDSGVLETK